MEVRLFETVVWASDGSPNADRALEVAKTLALDRGASIVVVHVVQHYATHEDLAVYPDEDRVKRKLEQTVEQLSNDGFKASLRITDHVGPQPAHEIADIAREVRADLIVMGTRGHGAIAGATDVSVGGVRGAVAG
jgi:nucleotide-binding universal stress UspA family protein